MFCHWNDAAYRKTGTGQASFWEVMRIGSERFVDDRFADSLTATEAR